MRWNGRRSVSLTGIVVAVGVLGLAPAARASYPGAAGVLAFQRSSAYTIENDNGVSSQSFSLAFRGSAGGPFGTPLSCQALDGDYLRGAGSRARRLTRAGATWPDCSHDSRTLVFDRHAALYTIRVTGRHLRHLTSPNALKTGCPRPTSRGVLCVQGRPALSPAGGLVALTALSVRTSHCGGSSFPPQCTNLSERLMLIDLRGRVRRSDRVATNDCQPDYGLADDELAGVDWQPLPNEPLP